MAIPDEEREKMLAVRLCGPRVIARLDSIGITKLADLAERDPHQLVHQVNIAAGRPIWHPPIATQAMTNLINAAVQQAGVGSRQASRSARALSQRSLRSP